MERWSELRTALYVARFGTVTAAAAALGYHRATVNRHIDALEAEIGTRIFLRHSNGYTLTEAGEDVLRVAQSTEDLTEEMMGRVRGQSGIVDGEIRLSLVTPFAGLIMGAVDAFATQYPNCRVSIDTSEHWVRLEYGEAHIALRAGQKPDHPDYVVQSLGGLGVGLYAHETYRSRFGLPASEDDLAHHRFVLPSDSERQLPFLPWIEKHIRPEMIAVASEDVWVSVEAISRGVGIGFLLDHEARARQNLHRVLSTNRAWSAQLWLTTHVDVHRTQKVQSMIKHIRSAFASFQQDNQFRQRKTG